MINIPLLAMLFGIISTTQLHLAKSMERQGIETFEQIKAKLKLKGAENENIESNLKKPIIYSIGLIMNNTIFIWQMLGTSFGLASHYTSMFGLGLVALMIYSSKILKERITRTEYIGAAVLIFGTLILGLENINQQNIDRTTLNTTSAVLFFIIFIIVGIITTRIALRKNIPLITGILFGFFAGGCGCLDPVFKEVGLTFGGGSGPLPIHLIGWIIYLSSFVIGFLGFAFTQWGFARKAKASVLVPAYNSIYVTLPIILQIFTFPGYSPSGVTILGILVTITGIILMQVYKKSDDSTTHLIDTTGSKPKII
ncbi:MAG: hypothetical protein ACFFBD_02665 [Candidatus Hodarchaeota archaeon]